MVSGWSCVPCRTCGGDQTRGWHLHDRVTAEPARDTTNDIAAVLTGHLAFGDGSGRLDCTCGQRSDTTFERVNHVAAAIADRLAAHTSHQQAQLAAVEKLADEYDRHENWRIWGVPQSIRAALATNPGQEKHMTDDNICDHSDAEHDAMAES